MKTKQNLCLFLMFMFLLVSCASETNHADLLIGSETCRPPCWMDIQPGLTKTDNAIALLKEHENRSEGTLTILDSGIIRWQSADDYNSYIYESSSNIVSKIELDVRPRSIRLDDVIATFGDPSSLDIGKVRDGFFGVTTFYPEKGLAFVATGDEFDGNQPNMGFVIQPNMNIAICIFFQAGEISSIVPLFYGKDAISEALSDIQDWMGYGVYRER